MAVFGVQYCVSCLVSPLSDKACGNVGIVGQSGSLFVSPLCCFYGLRITFLNFTYMYHERVSCLRRAMTDCSASKPAAVCLNSPQTHWPALLMSAATLWKCLIALMRDTHTSCWWGQWDVCVCKKKEPCSTNACIFFMSDMPIYNVCVHVHKWVYMHDCFARLSKSGCISADHENRIWRIHLDHLSSLRSPSFLLTLLASQ